MKLCIVWHRYRDSWQCNGLVFIYLRFDNQTHLSKFVFGLIIATHHWYQLCVWMQISIWCQLRVLFSFVIEIQAQQKLPLSDSRILTFFSTKINWFDQCYIFQPCGLEMSHLYHIMNQSSITNAVMISQQQKGSCLWRSNWTNCLLMTASAPWMCRLTSVVWKVAAATRCTRSGTPSQQIAYKPQRSPMHCIPSVSIAVIVRWICCLDGAVLLACRMEWPFVIWDGTMKPARDNYLQICHWYNVSA